MSDTHDKRFSMELEIKKTDDAKRIAFGFAKFSEDPDNRGYLYVDKQGDLITPEDLEDSAYDYVLTSRDAGEMHVTKGAATLVESVVITPEKLEAWGLEGDAVPIGWWTGYKIHEPSDGAVDPWGKIIKGEYAGFSVEGLAVRVPVEKMGPTVGSVHQDRPLTEEEEEDEEDEKKEKTEKVFTHSFDSVGKHEGEDHPESSHGNRLFSEDADPIGDLMKQLKTRFKRTDVETIKNLVAKFSRATGEKDMLSHDQLVTELARRNIIKPDQMSFKTERFKKLRDEIQAAVTEDIA